MLRSTPLLTFISPFRFQSRFLEISDSSLNITTTTRIHQARKNHHVPVTRCWHIISLVLSSCSWALLYTSVHVPEQQPHLIECFWINALQTGLGAPNRLVLWRGMWESIQSLLWVLKQIRLTHADETEGELTPYEP